MPRVIKQLAIANDGTLYAVNGQPVAAGTNGGVLRSLNPLTPPRLLRPYYPDLKMQWR